MTSTDMADRFEAEANQHLLDTTDWGLIDSDADQELRHLSDRDWQDFQRSVAVDAVDDYRPPRFGGYCDCDADVFDITCPKHGF